MCMDIAIQHPHLQKNCAFTNTLPSDSKLPLTFQLSVDSEIFSDLLENQIYLICQDFKLN